MTDEEHPAASTPSAAWYVRRFMERGMDRGTATRTVWRGLTWDPATTTVEEAPLPAELVPDEADRCPPPVPAPAPRRYKVAPSPDRPTGSACPPDQGTGFDR